MNLRKNLVICGYFISWTLLSTASFTLHAETLTPEEEARAEDALGLQRSGHNDTITRRNLTREGAKHPTAEDTITEEWVNNILKKETVCRFYASGGNSVSEGRVPESPLIKIVKSPVDLIAKCEEIQKQFKKSKLDDQCTAIELAGHALAVGVGLDAYGTGYIPTPVLAVNILEDGTTEIVPRNDEYMARIKKCFNSIAPKTAPVIFSTCGAVPRRGEYAFYPKKQEASKKLSELLERSIISALGPASSDGLGTHAQHGWNMTPAPNLFMGSDGKNQRDTERVAAHGYFHSQATAVGAKLPLDMDFTDIQRQLDREVSAKSDATYRHISQSELNSIRQVALYHAAAAIVDRQQAYNIQPSASQSDLEQLKGKTLSYFHHDIEKKYRATTPFYHDLIFRNIPSIPEKDIAKMVAILNEELEQRKGGFGQLKVCTDTEYPIRLAYAYYNAKTNEWVATSWENINPKGCKTISLPGAVPLGTVLYYAEEITSKPLEDLWEGTSGVMYINTNKDPNSPRKSFNNEFARYPDPLKRTVPTESTKLNEKLEANISLSQSTGGVNRAVRILNERIQQAHNGQRR